MLVTTSGRDRPGVLAAFFAALAAHDVEVLDVEQLVVQGRMIAGMLLAVHGDPASLRRSLGSTASALRMEHEVMFVGEGYPEAPDEEQPLLHVMVLGHPLRPGAIGAVCQRVADVGGNIQSVTQLSRSPGVSLELTVRADERAVRESLAWASTVSGLDIAVERAGLAGRLKRLVLVSIDAALVQGDPIEQLAARAGEQAEARRILTAAGRGELDLADALAARVGLLAGLPVAELHSVCDGLRLTSSASALLREIKALGYAVGIVSSGPSLVTDRLADELGLDFAEANELEVRDGRLTGRLVGETLDRSGKAKALHRFAAQAGATRSQTVAIGDGPYDIDLLQQAGLGITFNTSTALVEVSGAEGGSSFLDAVLHILGFGHSRYTFADLESA